MCSRVPAPQVPTSENADFLSSILPHSHPHHPPRLRFLQDVDGTPLDAKAFAHYYLASDNANRERGNTDTATDVEHQETGPSDFEMDIESEDETLEVVRPTRARAVKKNATRATPAVNKRAPPKRIAKAGNKSTTTSEKNSATCGSASKGPARRTRSSTVSRPKQLASCFSGRELRSNYVFF